MFSDIQLSSDKRDEWEREVGRGKVRDELYHLKKTGRTGIITLLRIETQDLLGMG